MSLACILRSTRSNTCRLNLQAAAPTSYVAAAQLTVLAKRGEMSIFHTWCRSMASLVHKRRASHAAAIGSECKMHDRKFTLPRECTLLLRCWLNDVYPHLIPDHCEPFPVGKRRVQLLLGMNAGYMTVLLSVLNAES